VRRNPTRGFVVTGAEQGVRVTGAGPVEPALAGSAPRQRRPIPSELEKSALLGDAQLIDRAVTLVCVALLHGVNESFMASAPGDPFAIYRGALDQLDPSISYASRKHPTPLSTSVRPPRFEHEMGRERFALPTLNRVEMRGPRAAHARSVAALPSNGRGSGLSSVYARVEHNRANRLSACRLADSSFLRECYQLGAKANW